MSTCYSQQTYLILLAEVNWVRVGLGYPQGNLILHLQLKKAFGMLLADGAAFYKAMAYKLQLVYGDVGYKPTTKELAEMASQITDISAVEKPINTSLSVHRCLICIGDLTRYDSFSSPVTDFLDVSIETPMTCLVVDTIISKQSQCAKLKLYPYVVQVCSSKACTELCCSCVALQC